MEETLNSSIDSRSQHKTEPKSREKYDPLPNCLKFVQLKTTFWLQNVWHETFWVKYWSHTIYTPLCTGVIETLYWYLCGIIWVSGQSGSWSDFLLPTFAASVIKCQDYHVTFPLEVAHTHTHNWQVFSHSICNKKYRLLSVICSRRMCTDLHTQMQALLSSFLHLHSVSGVQPFLCSFILSPSNIVSGNSARTPMVFQGTKCGDWKLIRTLPHRGRCGCWWLIGNVGSTYGD